MIGKTIGQYQVIDKIGEGGMGAVYKAEDTTLHRLVALKTIARSLSEDPEAKERFVREAQAASALNHPNITTVFELVRDEEEDSQLICMEYVEGKTIRDMVETGTVSVRKAIDIIMQAAEALEAAHNKGILHRDVKSANIMVSMEGRVKVMDFGLAHLESRSQLTRTGTTMGTLSYSSPEQISGRPVDQRSEVFSLGVVFYELLTGKLPFSATNEAELVFSIINNEPERLTRVRDDVPDLVEAVAQKMLEKDPELRYQSCGEVINDLKGIRKEMETSTVSITGALKRVQAGKRKKLVTWIGIGVMAAVAIVVLLLIPRGPNLDEGMVVAATFENLTGDPSLDHIGNLPVLLISQGVQSSGLLRPFPEQSALQLNTQIASAMKESGQQLDSSRLLAEGSGSGYVITGQYWTQGDTLFIQSNVIDFTGGKRGIRLGGTDPIKGTSDNLDAILPTLLEQTLVILQRHLHPMSDWITQSSSTTSLRAMTLYMDAFKVFPRREYREVIDLTSQARQEDPSYMAPLQLMITASHNLGLAGSEDWLSWYSMCDSLIQLAEMHDKDISQYEREWVNDIKGWLLGDREASYRASVAALGSSPGAVYEAGLNTRNINRPEEALRYCNEIDYDHPWAKDWINNWTVHADVLCMLGRFRKAEQIIRHGQEVNPESSTLLNWEARLLAVRGRIKALDRLVEECLETAPSGSWLPTHTLLSAAQVLHGYGQPAKAQELLEASLAWLVDHPDELQRNRGHHGLLLLMAGRLEEARSVYEELLGTIPDDRPDKVIWMGRYGALLAMLGEREAALEVSREIAQVSGQRYRKGRHTYWRASIAAYLGDLDEAMRLLIQAESEGNAFSWIQSYAFELAPLRDYPPFVNWIKPRG